MRAARTIAVGLLGLCLALPLLAMPRRPTMPKCKA